MQPLRSGQFTILPRSALVKTCSVIGHSAQLKNSILLRSRVSPDGCLLMPGSDLAPHRRLLKSACAHCARTTSPSSSKADSSWCNKKDRYSITSSQSCKSDCRGDRPSVLAVFRLRTSSNLIGDCTGKFPGCSPLRMRSTYTLARRLMSPVFTLGSRYCGSAAGTSEGALM